MFSVRTPPMHGTSSCRLVVEPLEDRQVLSTLGVLPPASQLLSAPAVPALVRTVAVVSSNEIAVIQTGVHDVLRTAVDASPQGAADQAPLSQVPALVPSVFGDVLRIVGQPESVPTVLNVPVLSALTPPAAPGVEVSLNVADLNLGLGADLAPANAAGISPALNVQVNLGQGNAPAIAPELNAQVNLGQSNAVGVGPELNAQVNLDSQTQGPAHGAGISIGLGLGVNSHINSAGGDGLGSNAGANIPAGVNGTSTPQSVISDSETGRNAAVVPEGLAPAIVVGQPTQPAFENTTLVTSPGRETGQPLGVLNDAAGAGPILPATNNEPALPADPNAREVETLLARESFSPETSGLLTDAAPFDLAAMDNALQHFLDQLDDLRDNVGIWLNAVGPIPWAFMTLAVAGAACTLLRSRRRQVDELFTKNGERDALKWLPALKGLKEE